MEERRGRLAVLCGLAILLLLYIATGQSQSQSKKAADDEEQIEPQALAPPPATAAEKAARDRVGEHFDPSTGLQNQRRPLDEPPQPGDPPLPPIDEGLFPVLPALPYAETSIAVLGHVAAVRTYLTPNRLSLYTEYSIEVEEVFRAESGIAVKQGDAVLVVRRGGTAKFPDDRVIRWEPSNTSRQLRQGRRYVLFLTRNPNISRYVVTTAYELKSGRVLVTRAAGLASSNGQAVRQLTAMNETEFLSAVRVAATR
jgi:hypothetical protein